MNSLIKVPPYSKLNFQRKIFFTQNWCNITLSNHDNNTIKNQKSQLHTVINVFDKEHEEIIIKIGVKIQIQYTKGNHPINIPTKFGYNWFNEVSGQRRRRMQTGM